MRIKIGKDDERIEISVPPPLVVVRDVASLPELPLPGLAGIIEAPTIRPDGSLLTEPGYDAATRLYYDPAPGLSVPPIPQAPSSGEVRGALRTLHDLLCDFPFVDASSQAHAYALLLTPILRPFIRGHAPLLLVDKPAAGTGASLLVELAAIAATGRAAALMTAPSDDAEWRKKLTSLLMDGAAFISIDNVEGRLASPSLAAVLTSTTWRDRVLGRSETVSLDMAATSWAATGNNVQLGGDLPRRAIWIRMDAQAVRPWQRAEFRHPDLLGYALENRGRIVAAAMILARAWIAAGHQGPPVLARRWAHSRSGAT